MKGYIFEIRESDGNDCTVYDYITEAESLDAAQEELDTAKRALSPAHCMEVQSNVSSPFLL